MALDPQFRPSSELSKAAQASLGLPPNFQRASPFPFSGVNQTDDRSALQEQEFYWLENILKTGAGKLRALWDIGAALYTPTPPRTIVSFFWFNIGPIDYVAVFLDNGTAIQVRRSDGAQTVISATPNTFYVAGGMLPACCGSGGQYLLIANNNKVNDYWIWDGSTLFTAGTIGPVVTITSGGSGYTSVPTVTAFGGTGSGIVATASIANGSVVAVHITNPGTGYSPGDIVQFLFTGGGTDDGAELTATITPGVVSAVIITDGGTGYSSAPAVGLPGGGGAGAAATAIIDGGIVTSVIITNGGSGYTGNPGVTFTGGGPSSPATGYSTITAGAVTAISVVSGGTNFTSTPLLTISGGGGTGATATATLTGGVITSGTVLTGGSGYNTTPAVLVSGGLNNAAQAQAELMPFGISGTYIETYQSRVWVPHPHQSGQMWTGGIFNVSAPGSLTDFATSSGGLEFTSTDRYLRSQYTIIRQANGYLYEIGDSSISVISNVQTSGNPPSTTFSYQNADPQVGSSYPNTAIDFGRTILLANQIGMFGIFGGSAVKVSAKMDRVFEKGIFPGNAAGTPCVTPSSASVIIYDVKLSALNMTITDPFTAAPRTVMILWNEKEWFVASQSKTMTFIGGLESASNLFAYGTDGLALYPMFTTASENIEKIVVTRYWGIDRPELIKMSQRFYVVGESFTVDPVELYWTTDFAGSTAEGVLEGQGSIMSPNNFNGTTPVPVPLGGGATGKGITYGLTDDVQAVMLGFKVATTSPDFEINQMAMGYLPVASIF